MGLLDSIGEQVDTTVDDTVGGVEDFTGVTAWKQTDTAENLDEQVAEGGFLDRVDAGAKALVDVTLDNPNASLQEGVQTGMVEAYQAGSGDETATDEDVAAAWKDAVSDIDEGVEEEIEGTVADNKATDAVAWAGRAVVAEPAEAVFGGLTGVDVAEGDTEANVGAMDLFDVGVGAATAGTGTVAARAVSKGATEAAPIMGRLAARGSDEGAQAAVKAADDSGRFVTRLLGRGSDEGAQAASEAPKGAPALPAPDEAAQATTKAGDELADVRANRPLGDIFDGQRGLGDLLGRGSDEAAQVGDDAAQTADESGGFMSRVLGRGGDDAAKVGDEGAQIGDDAADDAAEEGASLLSRLTPNSKTGKIAAGGTGAFLAGGAATTALNPDDAPDDFETAGGLSFSKTGSLDPTDEFPNGGAVYNVSKDYKSKGYWVYLGSRGRNLILLDEDRNTRTAKISVSDFKEQQSGGAAGRPT